jgi:hypothetical protein
MTGCPTIGLKAFRRQVFWPAVLTLVGLLLAGSPLVAQEPGGEPTLRGAVEEGAWTVGDRIGFTLVLEYTPGLEVALPGVEKELGPFQVRDFEDGGSRTLENGRLEQTWHYGLTAYETGDLDVPPVTVALTGGADGTVTVSSEPVAVSIQTVLAEGEEPEDIADLRPAAHVPYSFIPLILWSLSGLIVLVGLLWFRARWLARRRQNAQQDQASWLPPRELAIRELQRLTASDLLKHDRFKEFYIAISGIIDRLLYGALGVPTVERTSWEILRDIRERVPGTSLVRITSDFFEACDRVKFSRHQPGDAENSGIIAAAYQLVDLAAPEHTAPETMATAVGQGSEG